MAEGLQEKPSVSDLRARIAERIREARVALGLSQAELADRSGLVHAQTVSDIERGRRELRAVEAVRLAQILHLELYDLLSPAPPRPRPQLLWREAPAIPQEELVATFFEKCRAWSTLERVLGRNLERSIPEIPSTSAGDVSYSYAERLAGAIAPQLELGARPALALQAALETKWGIKIWYADIADGSAASVVGDFGMAVLMAKSQPPWRRNFSLAHELFHLLTWEFLGPAVVSSDDPRWEKIERVAQAFAARIVLPTDPLLQAYNARVEAGHINYADIIGLAREFGVSTDAVLWRLVILNLIAREEVERVLGDAEFRALDRRSTPAHWWDPPPLPSRFVQLAYEAYIKGRLSRSVLARYLDTNLVNLRSRLLEYGLDEEQTLETRLATA